MRRMSLTAIATVAALVFTGCNKDSEKASGPSLPGVPAVTESMGSLDTEKYKDMPNEAMTEENLTEAMNIFGSVFMGMGGIDQGGEETAMSRAMKERAVQSEAGSDTLNGMSSGKMIMSYNYKGEEDGSWVSAAMTMAYHDYSNDGQLFLGGAVGAAFLMQGSTVTYKIKGTINFAGAYAGSLIYDLGFAMNMETQEFAQPTGSIKLVSGGQTYDLTSYLTDAM